MRGVFLFALAGLLAVFVIASPKPASALPAAAALDINYTNTDLVEVRRKYRKRYRKRNRYRRGRYYRPYRYRPYRSRYRSRYRWWW